MFALQVSPQPHPSKVSLLPSSLQVVTQYLISAASGYSSARSQQPWSPCHDLHSAHSPLLLVTPTHYSTSKLETVSASGQSPHHVWHQAHPPSQCLQTLWKAISILIAQSMKGPWPSGLIRFEIQGKTSTGINREGWSSKGLILKVILNATWRVCIFSMAMDSILQMKVLKATNHFNNYESPPATLIRKLPATKDMKQ